MLSIAKPWFMKPALGALVLLMGVVGHGAGANDRTFTSDAFRISYRDIDLEEVEKFAAFAENGRAAVAGYLDRDEAGLISVSIDGNTRFPRWDPNQQRIVVPANRLRGAASGPRRLRGRGTAIILVITGVVAPSRHREWGRFLEMGLGVYLQERFGDDEDPSYPTMGRDLHEETVRLARDFGRLISLGKAERERTATTRFRRARTLAQLEEGSFVRFLIESRGLARFLKFYDGAPPRQVYDMDLAALEAEWRRMILSMNVSAGD